MTSDELMKANYENYENSNKKYKKAYKDMLSKIPRSDLKEMLIEFKIIKQDYLTGECEMKEKK